MAFGKGKSKGKPTEVVNDQELPESEDMIKVESWDEWFDMCGAILPEVEAYQTRVWNYHDLMLNPVDRDRAFRDRHDREFWRTDPPVTPKQLITSAKIAGGAMVLAFFAGMIAFTMAKKGQTPGIIEAIGASFSEALILAVGCLVGIFVISVVSFVARRMSRISWFKKRNPRMASAMRYIPPRYRNAFCLDTLYLLYREYDVASFSAAIATLDVHIQNNADTYVPIRILFDVPYSQADEAIDAGQAVDLDDDGDPVVTSEALPADIASHTREGVENAEEALDSLIGLENVKKQVRQMKRRIEFYDGNTSGQSGDNVFLLGPAGSGKALADDTLIPVADARGFVPIGDIVVGDEVFDECGKPTKVLGVYPQGSIPAYKVQFSDGSSLICNDEHLFCARTQKQHKTMSKYQTVSVREMLCRGIKTSDDCNRWWIPVGQELDRTEVDLPLDPYVLGQNSVDDCISMEYLIVSSNQRHAFLRGILDAKGCVSSDDNRCDYTFVTMSEVFAQDVVTLVTSLGMRAIVDFVDDSYRVHICGDIDDMAIVSIEPLNENISMTCIYVDAESHLYQAGTEHIVTHNTEVARILTKIFYDFGYIRKNRIVEVDGEYLKSPYVGQTGERTSAIVQWAMGGVLFVDEAYLLFNEKDNNSVGSEATGVLLKAMEDHRDDLIVIFAGYEDAMNRLIASNEGFASRVKHKLYFDMYSPEELTQIFELFLSKAGQHVDKIDPDARELLKSELEAESKLPGFGNARSARNACDALLDIHADRFIEGAEDPANRGIITYGDVEMFVEQQKKKFAADGRNFMATNHIDEGIISSAELRSRTRKGAADWKKAMDSLVGMERVKQEIIAFKERADFFRESGIEDTGITLNLQLVGEAGTGKTTAAAIVASILYDAGYIRENRYLDVNGDFFKASYVGQTGKRTQAILEYSKGMVLFIDEAYLLSASAGSGHDFGAEAIGVIVDAMEKNRGELVILFAGYEREMAQFMSVNSGLASRIAATLHFEPYDMREMMTIFARMCAQRKFKVDSGAWPNVKMAIEAAQARPNFGNARFVRQLSQDAISRHATRFAHGKVSEGNKFVIEAGDIVVEL